MPAPFIPIRDYHGTQHVLGAPSLWVHPGNGNIYTAIIEQISGVHQDLAIYRLPSGTNTWVEVKRYRGTIDSAAQIAFGSAAIGLGGNMIVVTSLIIPGAPQVTVSGFQGVWLREFNVDAPYSLSTDMSSILSRLAHLEMIVTQQTFAEELTRVLARLDSLDTSVENLDNVVLAIHNATA